MRWEIESYMSSRPCPECKGTRLKPAILGVTIQDKNIVHVTSLSVGAQRVTRDETQCGIP